MRMPKLTPAQTRDLAIAAARSDRPRQLKTGSKLWALGLVEVANVDRREYESPLYVITPRGKAVAAKLNLCDGEAPSGVACSGAGRGELGLGGAPRSQTKGGR